jgi:hypothetical protein
VSRYDALRAELAARFPGFRIVAKREAALQRVIGGLLRALTFGAQRDYLARYTTTIGRTVYTPDGFAGLSDDERYVILRHEAVHLEQFERYGTVGMAIAYLLLLPVGLAYFRARFERAAYAEGLRAMREVYGPEHLQRPDVRAHVVAQFTSGAYGWMWPFRASVERRSDGVVGALLDEGAGDGGGGALTPARRPA